MRHGDKINNLGRTAAHRRALLANLSIALIEHKRITTTLAKAKALRRYLEPIITKAKDNSTHSRRLVFSYLQNKEAIKELFGTVAEKVGDRPGGYLRIIRMGFRRGDGAETAMIELVDFNETYNPNAGKVRQAKKTRRGGKKVAVAAETAAAPVVEETVAMDEPVEEVVEQVYEASAEAVASVEETAAAAEEAVASVEETAAAAEETVAEVAEDTTEEAPAPAEEEKKDGEEA